MDPSLDSISHMLMEEDMEDATLPQQQQQQQQQHGDPSYQAIICSLYEIIGEHRPPKSRLVSPSHERFFDLHIPHQISSDKQDDNGFDTIANEMASRRTRFVSARRRARHVICPSISANLNALTNTKVQDYHELGKDTKASGFEKDRLLALSNSTSCSGKGGNAHFQFPSPYQEFSLKLAGVELSFEDLKLHDQYVALYVRDPTIIPAAARKSGNKEKCLAVPAGMGYKSGSKRAADAQDFVELKDLIVNCAQAVAVGDARVAHSILQFIRREHGASAYGNGSQRAAHYFSEALVARMRGTGGIQFRAMLHERPSAATILKAYKQCSELSPWSSAAYYFANQCILKAAERASRLHIVEYGVEVGLQWPFLINALADQKGGPPLLVITGIAFPQPGNNPAGRLEESGRRFAAHARAYNVPFQYHAIASSKWEDLDSSSFHFHEDEVLVVNCMRSLRRVPDESVDLVSPRQKLLARIHSLKPHLLIFGDVSVAYSSSFFVPRFREALCYHYNVLDMIDAVWGDKPERLLIERMYYGDILNIVACEGSERVERAETYKQWQTHIERAGFEQLLIRPGLLSRSRNYVKQHYHKDFFIHDDANKWMLLGWRSRPAWAISAWKLSPAQLS